VAGDPGRTLREEREGRRRGGADLFRANLKRAQEALRCLEEFAKALRSRESGVFKRLRFACYLAEESAEKHL
jgi:hypothetical protein